MREQKIDCRRPPVNRLILFTVRRHLRVCAQPVVPSLCVGSFRQRTAGTAGVPKSFSMLTGYRLLLLDCASVSGSMIRMIKGFLLIPRRTMMSALAIAVSACCLLCGYEFIRSVSQSLYIKAYTADRLPLVMALGPAGTFLMIYGYGVLLSFVGARRAVFYTSFLSAVAILACYLAINAGSRLATGFLYVFREAYIVLLIEQVWAFINSTVRRDEGAKLNGPICGIASLGAIAGGLCVQHFAKVVGTVNNTITVNGVTKNEIREIFMQVAGYAGFPASLNALASAKTVFEQDKR